MFCELPYPKKFVLVTCDICGECELMPSFVGNVVSLSCNCKIVYKFVDMICNMCNESKLITVQIGHEVPTICASWYCNRMHSNLSHYKSQWTALRCVNRHYCAELTNFPSPPLQCYPDRDAGRQIEYELREFIMNMALNNITAHYKLQWSILRLLNREMHAIMPDFRSSQLLFKSSRSLGFIDPQAECDAENVMRQFILDIASSGSMPMSNIRKIR